MHPGALRNVFGCSLSSSPSLLVLTFSLAFRFYLLLAVRPDRALVVQDDRGHWQGPGVLPEEHARCRKRGNGTILAMVCCAGRCARSCFSRTFHLNTSIPVSYFPLIFPGVSRQLHALPVVRRAQGDGGESRQRRGEALRGAHTSTRRREGQRREQEELVVPLPQVEVPR